MGTDIHGIFQRRTKSGWEDVPTEYEFERHYQLFAVLADVRNGHGFAGVPTGEPVTPISAPRGLPPDFLHDDEEHPLADESLVPEFHREYYDNRLVLWMGDHSHSWLTSDEILAWAEKAPTVVKVGVLSRDEYEKWDKTKRPSSYSGDVHGWTVVKINDNAVEKEKTPNWTHIRCSWTQDLSEELAYFFDEVKRLVREHGEIRFVFGFDS